MIWSMQRPFQQVMALQQSAPVLHSWPYSAQPGVLASFIPASLVGGVPGGGVGMPQIPWVEPIGWMQVEPTQQSPLIEHGPPEGTHDEGTPPSEEIVGEKQCKRPVLSGTQGIWLQQSMADEQVPPPCTHVVPSPLQRGTPRKSSWQTPELPTPAQQSLRAEELPQT
jgi:hypothetical protein